MGIERPERRLGRARGRRVAGLARRTASRAPGVGIVFQHSRPLHRQTVLENIKLALLPDCLLRLVAEPGVDAPRAGDRRARRPGRRAAPPSRARCPSPTCAGMETGQGHRARSQGGAGRRALRRPDRGRGRRVLGSDPQLPRRGPRGAAGRPQRQERGRRWWTACSPCTSASASPRARADEVMRNETVRRVYLGGEIETVRAPRPARKAQTPLLEVRDLSVLYGKAQALETRRPHGAARASSSPSSASTAPARPPCSTRSRASCPISGTIRLARRRPRRP